MNEKIGTCVSFEKEKVKESQSQSQSRRVAPSLDTHIESRVGGVTSMEHLAEEFSALRGDLHRREVMINQRDGVIA